MILSAFAIKWADVNYCGKMCKNPCGLKLHQNQGGTCAEFSGIPPHKADPGKDAGGAKPRVVPQGPPQTSKWLQLQTHADHHNLVGPKPTRRQGGEADCLIHPRTAITVSKNWCWAPLELKHEGHQRGCWSSRRCFKVAVDQERRYVGGGNATWTHIRAWSSPAGSPGRE